VGSPSFLARVREIRLKVQRSRSKDLFLLLVWSAAFGGLLYLYTVKGHNRFWLSLAITYILTCYWFGYVTCARIGLRPKKFVIGVGSDLAAFVMIVYLMLWLVCAVLWGWVGLVSTPIEIVLCIRRIASRGSAAEAPVLPVTPENDWGYSQSNMPQYPQPWGTDPSVSTTRPTSHRRK
jgi:hypothetical protein